MVQVDSEVKEQTQIRKNLVNTVNEHLAQTFGSDYIGNVTEETYGCTRGPTYHVGDRLGYIAQIRDSQGLWLKLLGQLGLRGGRAVQIHDFSFVGQFTDDNGLAIEVLRSYVASMTSFSKTYEKARGKKVNVKVVEYLHGRDFIFSKNNLSKGRENSY